MLPTFGYFTADGRFHREAGTVPFLDQNVWRAGVVVKNANNISSDCIARSHILSHLTLQHFKTNIIVFLSNIYKQLIQLNIKKSNNPI